MKLICLKQKRLDFTYAVCIDLIGYMSVSWLSYSQLGNSKKRAIGYSGQENSLMAIGYSGQENRLVVI